MRLFLCLIWFALASSATADWQVLLCQGDPDGRPDGWPIQKQRDRGQALPDGWVRMTEAQLASQVAARSVAMADWREVQATRPRREADVIDQLKFRIQNSGGAFGDLRILESQCELLRGLWEMVNATPGLTNRLTPAQFRRMERNDAKLGRVLRWISDAKDAVADIATNAAPVRPVLPDDGELEP